MTATRKTPVNSSDMANLALRVDQLQSASAQVDVSDLAQLDGVTAALTTTNQTIAGNKTLSGTTTLSGAVVMSNASVKMTALPTADPHVAGALWANSNVLTVSAG